MPLRYHTRRRGRRAGVWHSLHVGQRGVDPGRPGRIRPESLPRATVADESPGVVPAQHRGAGKVVIRLAEARRAAERQSELIVRLRQRRPQFRGAGVPLERLGVPALEPGDLREDEVAYALALPPAGAAPARSRLGRRVRPRAPKAPCPGRSRSGPPRGPRPRPGERVRRQRSGRRGAPGPRRTGPGRGLRLSWRARRTRAAPSPARRSPAGSREHGPRPGREPAGRPRRAAGRGRFAARRPATP